RREVGGEPGGDGGADADHDDRAEVDQPEHAQTDDLAAEELPRAHRAEQDLHDPAALLLDHAHRDHHDLPEDEHEQHQHQHDRDARPGGLVAGVGPDRLHL